MKNPSKPYFLGLIFIIIGLACYSLFPPESSKKTILLQKKDYNLLFISIDTLRADRLNTYGYKYNTSPEIQKFAKNSVVFDDAISVSSWTLPTHLTFLTGLFPSVHGITEKAKGKPKEDTVILTELLKDNAYRTFGYSGGGYFIKTYGFDRGFEKFIEHAWTRETDTFDFDINYQNLTKDLSQLRSDEKFFAFFHTYDVHCPYAPPKAYLGMFNTKGAEYINPQQCGAALSKHKLSSGQVKYISDRYDESIRYVDTKIGEIFKFLEKKGLLDKTIIIITSDHGEEFYEHGRIGHYASLHKELIKIPLIIHVPGVPPGRVKAQVSSVDLFDTIIEILEIENPPKTNGYSLWKLINTKNNLDYPRKFQYSELDSNLIARSHIDHAGHFINDQTNKEILYYNLKKDPTETLNLSHVEEKEVAKRQSEINLLENSFKRKNVNPNIIVKPAEIKQLESLGYF